ncbi:hypothetical protein GZ998_05485 [Actinomyces sp. 594]|uniref:hypothetical protein n=1 Tax=Actinomyces sp. 594 TaxID=2057793 RepID=UPI001C57402E|nr:hypothetical protein [Actinomyces sp. 594]MBW3068965.1 hypothetical protein [Actinomyces sp. 594]
MRLPWKKNRQQDWWSEPAQVPTDNGIDTGPRYRAARRMRWFVTACVFLCPVLALTLILVVSQTLTSPQPTDDDGGRGVEVPTQVRAAALTEVEAWIGQDPSPLPAGAQVLGWDRAEPVPTPRYATAASWETWTAYVLVATDSAVYEVGTRVNYSAATDAAEAVGTPSLDVLPTAEAGWSSDMWAGATSVTVDQTTDRAVNAWATAFASGDADALATVMADPDLGHTYIPLSGITGVSVSIDHAAARAVAEDATPDASTLMVAVTLDITRDGAERPVSIGYDLLVTGAGTGTARVVAWGPPGTGTDLAPWQNAVTGTTRAAASVPAPTTATATPEEN